MANPYSLATRALYRQTIIVSFHAKATPGPSGQAIYRGGIKRFLPNNRPDKRRRLGQDDFGDGALLYRQGRRDGQAGTQGRPRERGCASGGKACRRPPLLECHLINTKSLSRVYERVPQRAPRVLEDASMSGPQALFGSMMTCKDAVFIEIR